MKTPFSLKTLIFLKKGLCKNNRRIGYKLGKKIIRNNFKVKLLLVIQWKLPENNRCLKIFNYWQKKKGIIRKYNLN